MPLDSEIHRRRLVELELSTAALSGITNLSRNRVGAYLSGVGEFTHAEIIKVEETLNALDQLVLAAAPFQPTFQNVQRTKSLIIRLRGGEFDEKIKKQKEQQ